MEQNKYIEQIDKDLYYYAYMHSVRPQKIFMSNHLWSMLFTDDYCPVFMHMNDCPTYNGIPVMVFISDKLEYYLTSSGYAFEDED